MTDTPLPVNEPAEIANKIIRVAVTVAQDAAKIALVAEVPAFGFPVVSQITDFALGKVGDAIYQELAFDATLVIIKVQTSAQRDAYYTSIADLESAKQSGDPAEIERKLNEAKEALAKLVHFDGIAHP